MTIKILNVLTGGISTDGITSAWLSICKEWKKSGTDNIEMDFLGITENSSESALTKIDQLGFKIIPVNQRIKNPYKYIKELTNILSKGKYNAIHINGSSAFMTLELIAARICGIPARITHSHNTSCSRVTIHKILTPFFKYLNTSRLACSYDAGRWLYGKQDFMVFHNGISLDKFCYDTKTRNRIRSRFGFLDNEIIIGHVGKFNYQKNHEYLIEVFENVLNFNNKARLCLFGDGENFDNIRNLVSKKGIANHVHFMGCVDNIHEYLQAMDGMILPSRFEGLPNVMIEWQAAGLPSLVSDKITKESAPNDFIHFMSLDTKPYDWAKKFIEIIEEYGNRKTQSYDAIYNLVQNNFEISHQAKELIQLYNRLCT